jgi:hypothetical protein
MLDMPERQPWRRSPVRVQHGCPPIRFRRPGPGCPARPVSSPPGVQSARCPVTWARRPGSGVRPSGVHPSGVRPSGRVRLVPIRRWHWGQADAARQPAPRERAQVPVGCRVVERLGPTAEKARTRATPPRSPMVGGAVGGGPGPGRVWAAAVIDAGLPGRPGGRAERPSPAAARGHGRRLHRPRGCRSRDGWATTVRGCRGACRPRGRARRGRWACRRGMGVRPQRGPGSQRVLPACCRQRSDLRRWLVGLPGLEPGTSSLSGIEG